jgi:hypothetical protein
VSKPWHRTTTLLAQYSVSDIHGFKFKLQVNCAVNMSGGDLHTDTKPKRLALALKSVKWHICYIILPVACSFLVQLKCEFVRWMSIKNVPIGGQKL